jgi:hypothetical protein
MVQNELQKNQLSGSRRIYRYFLQNAGLKSVKSGTFTLIFMPGMEDDIRG